MTTYAPEAGPLAPTGTPALDVTFVGGLVGCPDWQRFTLYEHPDLPGIFVMQSSEDADATFLLARVADIVDGYVAQLHPTDLAVLGDLGVGTRPDVDVFSTLNTRDPDNITANLLGPLVVDLGTGVGRQVVLSSSPWSSRHPVFAAETR